jgi:hypothetical protein
MQGVLMKQLVGFVMFWVGIGILLTFFMPQEGWFIRALGAFLLVAIGYHLFSGCG